MDIVSYHDPICYTHSKMKNIELLWAVWISKKKGWGERCKKVYVWGGVRVGKGMQRKREMN